MRPTKIKDRCTRKQLSKCSTVAKLYDKVQIVYSSILDNNPDIAEIQCNVAFDCEELKDFASDFVCRKTNGDYLVRECTFRKKLSLPRTCKLLDASRTYWLKRGVSDWAIVIERDGDDYGD